MEAPQSERVYGGLQAALEKLTREAAILGEHTKRVREYDGTVESLNTSFDQVQAKLVRVASVRPGFSNILA